MLKKFASSTVLALLLALSSFAHAQYLTEIKTSFTGQTALFGPSAIFTAGSGGDGSYLACAYIEQGASSSVAVQLQWKDENGNSQNFSLTNGSGAQSGCHPIRNESGTAAAVETTGTVSGTYAVYTVGFGMWSVSPQKQGGITEPISADYVTESTTLPANGTLLSVSAYGTYLIAVYSDVAGSTDSITSTIGWSDANGSQSYNISPVYGSNTAGLALFLIRAVPSSTITLATTGTDNDSFDLRIRGVLFGTPATGSGPLTLSQGNCLGWTNPCTVSLAGGGMLVNAVNAEQISSGGAETVGVSNPGFSATGTAPNPVTILEPWYTGPGLYGTYSCGGGSTCPEYSAEFNQIIF